MGRRGRARAYGRTRRAAVRVPAGLVLRAGRALLAKGPVLLVGAGALFFLWMVFFIFFVPLPEPVVPVATRVLDRNGELVASLFRENRVPVSLSDVPAVLQRGIVAVEDERFYSHHGIDIIGVARAAVRNIRAGRIVEGGSTITGQVARTLYLTQEVTLTRKVVEALLALKLERVYSKEEILELYLNQIYLGHGAFGVEVASHTYFGKSAKELSLPEAAVIAGLPANPEGFSPYNDPDLALRRRNLVLDLWAAKGVVTAAQAEEAKAAPIVLAFEEPPRPVGSYFTDYVLSLIQERVPSLGMGDLLTGGYRIYTTLDVRLQRAAEEAVRDRMPEGRPDEHGVLQPQVGLVAMDPTNGHILAMVGGRSFAETQLNRAVPPGPGRDGVRRQPGSAFKPFLYAAVLESGFPLTSTQVCEPVEFPSGSGEPYRPTDYGPEPYHYAPLGIREAVRISDNVVAVRWAHRIGVSQVRRLAQRMGIDSALTEDLSLALGSSEVSVLEMARAYSTLANGGLRVWPLALLRVEDRFGKVVPGTEDRVRVERALDEAVAYLTTRLLEEPFRPRGTAAHLAYLLPPGTVFAGKTGTTDNQHDAWFVGYSPRLVCAVWVGSDTPSRLPGSGGTLAGPVWAAFMARAHEDKPAGDFFEPPGIVHLEVCRETGLLPNPSCPTVEEIFIAGTEPRRRHWAWHRWSTGEELADEEPPGEEEPAEAEPADEEPALSPEDQVESEQGE